MRAYERRDVLLGLRGAREFLVRPESPRTVEVADSREERRAEVLYVFHGIICRRGHLK
jgi:hypothetical protein